MNTTCRKAIKGKIFACSNDIMNELMQKDPESFDMVYAKMSRTMNQKKKCRAWLR